MRGRSLGKRSSTLTQGSERSDKPQTDQLPACSQGFVYTVLPGDTFYLVADRFGISLNDLVAANPQIPDPSRIQPGLRTCVPYAPPPIIGPVELLDPEGRPLVKEGAFTMLTCNTTILVPLYRATTLYIFLTPTGTEAFSSTRLIGAVPVQPAAETIRFHWQVPSNILGYLYVIACNGQSCRASDQTGVVSSECPG